MPTALPTNVQDVLKKARELLPSLPPEKRVEVEQLIEKLTLEQKSYDEGLRKLDADVTHEYSQLIHEVENQEHADNEKSANAILAEANK